MSVLGCVILPGTGRSYTTKDNPSSDQAEKLQDYPLSFLYFNFKRRFFSDSITVGCMDCKKTVLFLVLNATVLISCIHGENTKGSIINSTHRGYEVLVYLFRKKRF